MGRIPAETEANRASSPRRGFSGASSPGRGFSGASSPRRVLAGFLRVLETRTSTNLHEYRFM